jgi:hypothetical protein
MVIWMDGIHNVVGQKAKQLEEAREKLKYFYWVNHAGMELVHRVHWVNECFKLWDMWALQDVVLFRKLVVETDIPAEYVRIFETEYLGVN